MDHIPRFLGGRLRRPPTTEVHRLLSVAVVLVVLVACNSAVVVTLAPPTPVVPTETELPDLGGALLVLGSSGTFQSLADRTIDAPARMVIWDDGRVVVDVSDLTRPPIYVSIVLPVGEFDDLQRILRDAAIETYHNENVAGGGNCADCNVTILQTDVDGHTVEVAVKGLQLSGRQPGEPAPDSGYPPNVVEVLRVVVLIRADAIANGLEWTGEVPRVAISPPVIGG